MKGEVQNVEGTANLDDINLGLFEGRKNLISKDFLGPIIHQNRGIHGHFGRLKEVFLLF